MDEKTSRDIRQEKCVEKWVKAKCKGTLIAATGFGKTRVALMCIKKFLDKNPQASIMVVVPTQTLKDQWIGLLLTNGIAFVNVEIINTVVKDDHVKFQCDLLVIDEIHTCGANQFFKVFEQVKYKIILGLTATLERLDGRHILLEKKAPVFDEITIEECLKNQWVSTYKKYKVLLDVDLTEYTQANTEFYNHFAFFNFDFDKAMKCLGPTGYLGRESLLKQICSDSSKYKDVRKEITAHAFGFMKTLQARKSFIANHPKKIEITNKILENRLNSKAITFSPTIKIAEKIKYGGVLHSKQTKKKRNLSIEEFIGMTSGCINTSKALDVGNDIPGVNLGIILGIDSSKTRLIQRTGRIIRYSPGKEAEIFILVIKGTVEEEWLRRSSGVSSYITIDEEGLEKVLANQPYTPKKEKEVGMLFRF